MDGYILIHRKLLEWEWYSSVNDTRLFIHCLLKANWKDGRFKGMVIPRGSFVTSFNSLVEETGLSRQQVRTSLEHLKSTHEITQDTNHQYSIITINKYNEYQIDNTQSNKRITNEQQTSNTNRININKEIKEINIKENIKRKYGMFENVLLTDDELQKLKDRFNDYEEKIEKLSSYIASKGAKYKSHYATILNWSRQDDKNIPGWFNKETEKKKLTKREEKLFNELFEEN